MSRSFHPQVTRRVDGRPQAARRLRAPAEHLRRDFFDKYFRARRRRLRRVTSGRARVVRGVGKCDEVGGGHAFRTCRRPRLRGSTISGNPCADWVSWTRHTRGHGDERVPTSVDLHRRDDADDRSRRVPSTSTLGREMRERPARRRDVRAEMLAIGLRTYSTDRDTPNWEDQK